MLKVVISEDKLMCYDILCYFLFLTIFHNKYCRNTFPFETLKLPSKLSQKALLTQKYHFD